MFCNYYTQSNLNDSNFKCHAWGVKSKCQPYHTHIIVQTHLCIHPYMHTYTNLFPIPLSWVHMTFTCEHHPFCSVHLPSGKLGNQPRLQGAHGLVEHVVFSAQGVIMHHLRKSVQWYPHSWLEGPAFGSFPHLGQPCVAGIPRIWGTLEIKLIWPYGFVHAGRTSKAGWVPGHGVGWAGTMATSIRSKASPWVHQESDSWRFLGPNEDPWDFLEKTNYCVDYKMHGHGVERSLLQKWGIFFRAWETDLEVMVENNGWFIIVDSGWEWLLMLLIIVYNGL